MKPNETRWTSNQRKYIEWVATPEELREQRRLADFAEHIGISRVTLWRWNKIPGFHEAVQEQTKQYLGDALPEVLATLKEMARRGSFPHQKMYLEMLGMYQQRSVVDVNIMAARIAEESGLSVQEVLAEAESIVTTGRAE